MRTSTRLSALLTLGPLAPIAFVVACTGSGVSTTENVATSEARLVALATCDDVVALLRQAAKDEMNRQLDETEKRLDTDSGSCAPVYADAGASMGGGSSSSSGSSPAPAPASGSSSGDSKASSPAEPSSKSGTNNQVQGVDEADFIKSDSKYIYTAVGDKLEIVEAWPAATAHKVGAVAVTGTARKLFLDGDRAIVYSSSPKPQPTSGSNGYTPPLYSGRTSSGECTYGYDCTVAADGTQTHITIFDVSNRAAPTVLRTVTLSSSLIAARKIGHTVHTVVSEMPQGVPNLQVPNVNAYSCSARSPESIAADKIEIATTRIANEAIIDAYDFAAALPSATDSAAAAPGSCAGFYKPSIKDSATFTSVLSFDANVQEPLVRSTIVGRPGHVYASEGALYFTASFSQTNGYSFSSMQAEPEVSTVHKFGIGATANSTVYKASGLVKGHVLNQFAMDERNGDLRIATSSGKVPSESVHSTLSVLAQTGDALFVRGSVDNLAPKEDIRSVRFDGTRVFIVTFKKTDPLYVIDVSNHSAPVVRGELKIPGFSTYMHMMDENHLLTIGYDADDQGSFAYFQGVLLQIFDVSNPQDPKLAHKERIGTRGSSSEALANHLAFNYFAEKNLLALPMTICEGGQGNGSYGTNMTFSGLMVYDVTAANGFSLRGKVSHPNTSSGTGYNNAGCSNWWTQANSEVKRSLFMDQFVYSVSASRIKVNDVGNLSQDVATVALGQ